MVFNMGENNPQWKGGKPKYDEDGYCRIYKPDHPNRNSENRIFAHRLIYENYLSILFDEDVYIPNKYEIHHIKPIKEGGNNALINLQLVTKSEHQKLHKTKDMSDRFCLICKSKTYKDKKGNEHWRKYENGFLCKKCFYQLNNPNKSIPVNKRICIICDSKESKDKNGHHWYGNKEEGFKCKLCYDKESNKKRYYKKRINRTSLTLQTPNY